MKVRVVKLRRITGDRQFGAFSVIVKSSQTFVCSSSDYYIITSPPCCFLLETKSSPRSYGKFSVTYKTNLPKKTKNATKATQTQTSSLDDPTLIYEIKCVFHHFHFLDDFQTMQWSSYEETTTRCWLYVSFYSTDMQISFYITRLCIFCQQIRSEQIVQNSLERNREWSSWPLLFYSKLLLQNRWLQRSHEVLCTASQVWCENGSTWVLCCCNL